MRRSFRHASSRGTPDGHADRQSRARYRPRPRARWSPSTLRRAPLPDPLRKSPPPPAALRSPAPEYGRAARPLQGARPQLRMPEPAPLRASPEREAKGTISNVAAPSSRKRKFLVLYRRTKDITPPASAERNSQGASFVEHLLETYD